VRIAIVGSGGVGGYFGGRFAAAGADVTFLARGAHLHALRRNGLRIASPSGALHLPTVRATDDPRTAGPVDLVLFSVKLYDTEEALRLVPPLLGPDTVVVTFQNGVESVDLLTHALGSGHVAGGTAYIMSVVSAPGEITHTAQHRLLFGMPDGRPSSRLDELQALCAAAGVEGTHSSQITRDIWTKFVRLSVFSGMTSVARCPIGAVLADPALADMLDRAFDESIAVAAGKGISMDRLAAVRGHEAFAHLPPAAKSSMLEDLLRGRRLELPWLSGAVVRLGQETSVSTPVHAFITATLTPHVNGAVTA
jgi:2-dehydropantoate 2-reductase